MPITRGSWYSQLPPFGWFDPGDKPGSNALGVPDWQQGIATPGRKDLGQWFNVTPPGGGIPYPMQKTDIGPAPWTGRGVDISAAGAHQMGYTPKNFPTDANFKVEPIDLTGLGLAAKWNGGVPGDNQTAVAEGPPQQGRKMPNSSNGLLDMFQPTDPMGKPAGWNDAIAQRSNSLIGLGLGLLSPIQPGSGQTGMTQGLRGLMAGSQADTRNAEHRQQLARQAQQDAFQRSQAAQAQANFERTFGEGQMTEAEKLARASGLKPGSPEHQTFIARAIQAKSGENLIAQAEQRQAIAKAQGLDINDPKVKSWLAGGGTLNEEGKPLPAETAAAIAMGGKFLDEAPAIRAKIASGMATDTITGKVMTYFNAGEQGEVARKVKSGTEALLRALTGAGMGIAEAQKYVERYEIQPTDSSAGALSKFDQLQDELTRREQEAFRGRGGIPRDIIDRRKAAHEAIGKTATAPAPKAPAAPKAGHVEDGHVFKGGDPSDPKNWAPVR